MAAADWDVEFAKNQVLSLPFTWKDGDGVAVPLRSGSVSLYGAKYQIKDSRDGDTGDGATTLFTASVDDDNILVEPGDVVGKLKIIAPQSVTVLWEEGSYYHDFLIWLLADPDYTAEYMFTGKFKVVPSVTR